MANNRERLGELATMGVGRLLWRYSLPAVVGMLVMSLYNVIDRIFIGQGVGPEAIVGLAITFPVMNVATALGVLVGGGAAARMSIMLGQNNHHGAQLVLGNALTLTLAIGVCYLTVLAIFIDPLLMAFGASEASLPFAREFMLYLLPGLLLTNVTFTFNNMMRASGYPTRAMITMFIGAGCNVVLAPIFIFGLDLGIKGAAIATDISMAVSALFVMGHFVLPGSVVRFKKGIYSLKWHIVWGMIEIGAAPAVVNVASCFVNILINTSLYAHGGDMAIGASGLFVTYTSLLVTMILGVCQGLQPIVGYNYGAGYPQRLKRAYWLAVGSVTVVAIVGMLGGLLFPEQIARAFTSDDQLIGQTVHAFHLTLWAFWMVGFQIISTTLFQAIGKGGKAVFIGLTRQVIFLIPLMLWLPTRLGINGIWISFPVSDVFATLVTGAMIWRQLWLLSHRKFSVLSAN